MYGQVVPTNIEKQMMTHPAVEEVGVVGLPDEIDGERPLAFVVLRKGQTTTAEELIEYTNGNFCNNSLRLEQSGQVNIELNSNCRAGD